MYTLGCPWREQDKSTTIFYLYCLIDLSFNARVFQKKICYVSSQGIFQIKASGKWKDLFNAFIWACCGFFWSRGLQIKPSGFGDKNEWKQPKEADLAKTAQRQDNGGYIYKPAWTMKKQQFKPTTSHLQYRLIIWQCFRSICQKLSRKWWLKTLKGGRWSEITGLFSKQIHWTLVWAEKLSGGNNEL